MDIMQITINETDPIHTYAPREDECEKASNGYLMSVMAVMVGMPLPVINLLASIIFYLANRTATYYVRWHCTQAMVSQFTIFIINSIGLSWTLKILFSNSTANDRYFAYIATIICFNIFEFIINIITVIKVRKGQPAEWWFWGPLTTFLLSKTKQ